MQSSEEIRRLVERHGREQPTPLAALLRCAAGIVVLVAVAAGPWVVSSAGGDASRGPLTNDGTADSMQSRLGHEPRDAEGAQRRIQEPLQHAAAPSDEP